MLFFLFFFLFFFLNGFVFFPQYLGVRPVTIVYIESFARVKHLSLSGKLLYAFADIFLVQWADLLENYPRAKYLGVLV